MKKKKIPTLPYNVSSIIPDKVDGLNNLNTNMDVNMSSCGELGEEMKIDEATQNKLSTQDKDKLEKFIQDNDDVEEIKTFIAGLKSRSVNEDVEESRSFYDKLPQDIQIYLDEFDGPWIDYGELLGGKIFYEDEYDTYTWDNIEEFISDMRYNIRQIAEEYSQAPEDYDYTEEFEKVLQQSLLTEDLDTDLDDTELEIYFMNLI